jgi:hypothetical protein
MSTNKISIIIIIIIMGPISSSESALKVTYSNVGRQKNGSPAAGFRPSMCKIRILAKYILEKETPARVNTAEAGASNTGAGGGG